jgi:hypothetical protein
LSTAKRVRVMHREDYFAALKPRPTCAATRRSAVSTCASLDVETRVVARR